MQGVTRAATAVLLLVVVCVLAWMLSGPAAGDAISTNADVVGGIAGLLALVAVVAQWLRAAAHRRASAAPAATAVSGQTAADHLAAETLRYWQDQAKDRRITTPSPVTVRWRWASDEVAVPAQELQTRTEVLTAGIVTQLREQLFDRLGAEQARIVLLGQAGAGKTAAMLLLLIDILKHRAAGSPDPVPIWLTLGGWNPTTTGLRDWAAATLNRDYPALAAPEHGGPDTAAHLIRTGQVALFLDGLDEMLPAAQGAALQAIDRDATGLRVVLTSRPDQYRTALTQGRLYGAAVIDLLPVQANQAQQFLLAEQLGDRRHAWQQVINHIRTHPDSPAARTLTTPLALSLARDTYATANPTGLLDTNQYPTPEALLQHLLARSLTLAYPDPAQRAHATYWLSWIARHMGTNRDLRWWDIPTWTPRWHRAVASGLAGGLASGLGFGLTSGLAIGLTVGVTAGLAGGLAVGLAGGLAVGLAGVDAPHRVSVRWPTSKEWRDGLVGGRSDWWAGGLAVGLAFGLTGGLTGGLMAGLTAGLTGGLTAGLAFGLTGGLAGWLANVWSTPLATVRTASPFEVYRADRRRTMTVGLAFGLAGAPAGALTGGLVGTLTVGLRVGLTGGPAGGLVGALTIGLVGGLTVGLTVGLGPALQLAVLEAIWELRLKRARFMMLLQTALDKQVLRQAGAVYQFRHAALQDLLAAHDITTPAAEPRLTSKHITRL